MAFFQLMFQFLSQETVLNPDQTKELFEHYYFSSQQTEGVMNTYQVLRQEGRQEGRQENARLTVLRGKSNKIPTETLAYLSDLPLIDVNNLLKGYDKAYTFWLKSKGKAPAELPLIDYLSEQEVTYLMKFFSQKQQSATEN